MTEPNGEIVRISREAGRRGKLVMTSVDQEGLQDIRVVKDPFRRALGVDYVGGRVMIGSFGDPAMADWLRKGIATGEVDPRFKDALPENKPEDPFKDPRYSWRLGL